MKCGRLTLLACKESGISGPSQLLIIHVDNFMHIYTCTHISSKLNHANILGREKEKDKNGIREIINEAVQ